MRKSTVKALRKIINPDNRITKKAFRRLKKAYNRLSSDEKARCKRLELNPSSHV